MYVQKTNQFVTFFAKTAVWVYERKRQFFAEIPTRWHWTLPLTMGWNPFLKFFLQFIAINVYYRCKVKKILKGSLDSNPSPSLSVKIQISLGKFAWGVKAKHCWVFSTNFWKQKACWHHTAMFCLITSSKHSHL